MTAADWETTGWGYRAKSIDELTRVISRIGTLRLGHRFVWRGVTNYRWPILSSLQRAIHENPDYLVGTKDGRQGHPPRVRQAERRILGAARDWGLGTENGTHLSDLQLLAVLQHHGVPTRLIDVTSDPMTALWFACQHATDSQGRRLPRDTSAALIAFNVTRFETLSTLPTITGITIEGLDDPTGWALSDALKRSHSRPFILEPGVRDVRMIAQQGRFLIGSPPSDSSRVSISGLQAFTAYQDAKPPMERLAKLAESAERGRGRPSHIDFCVLIIPSRLKGRMIQYLETTYDKSRRTIYPDVDGFSAALGVSAANLPEVISSSTQTGIVNSLSREQGKRLQSHMTAAGLGIPS